MKYVFVILIIGLSCTWSIGQGFEADEAPRVMQKGTYNSFYFGLPDVSKEDAEKEWKKFMSDFRAKVKYDKKAGTWVADNATMPRISSNTIDVYARIIEDSHPKKRTSMIVWFDLGGAYVSTDHNEDQSASAQAILTEFAMIASRHHAEKILKAEEEALTSLDEELKKLRKDNKDYRKEIEKAQATIDELEKTIRVNESDQQKMESAIDEQRELVKDARAKIQKFN